MKFKSETVKKVRKRKEIFVEKLTELLEFEEGEEFDNALMELDSEFSELFEHGVEDKDDLMISHEMQKAIKCFKEIYALRDKLESLEYL